VEVEGFLDEKPERVQRMDLIAGYARALRAIGQALETLEVADFNFEPDGDSYLVTGTSSGNSRRISRKADPTAPVSDIAVSYSPGDVERLEREGRNQRANVHGTTDSSRLSQALRVIGSYLSQKYSCLLRISRKGESFEVQYQSSLGSQFSENFSAADLYDLWVRFYLQRSMRAAS
jgi:hypothetical protein